MKKFEFLGATRQRHFKTSSTGDENDKALEMFNCQWLPQKIVTSVVANRRRAGIALLRILWKTWKTVLMWKHRAMMRVCVPLVGEI